MSAKGAEFGTWLRGKLLERRMSLAQLCREAGCDYTYLWRIINHHRARGRKYTRPSYDLTRRVGAALAARQEALAVAGYTPEVDLEAARAADRRAQHDRDVASVKGSAGDAPQPDQWRWRRLPLLGQVEAGDLHEALENPDEHAILPEWLAGRADFALRVRGDSMRPTLLEGDIVAVREQPTADAGQLIVVLQGDEATVKRLEMKDGVPVAAPDNARFKTITIGARARIAGVVVGSYRPPEVLLRRPR